MELSLREYKWYVKGYWPWVPVKGSSMEIGTELMGVTDWLPATVPGGVHQDLYQAGLIQNPYQDLNSLHCEWVENRWWVYKTTFERPPISGSKVELIFKGLDYEAIVYVNNQCLGEHKGMYHPAVFDITEILDQHDHMELVVVLKQAPDEMAQIGKTSETFTQKSRFNYKWDFSTRLVNVGIWDDVILRVHNEYSLRDVYIQTDMDNGEGVVRVSAAAMSNMEDLDPSTDLKLSLQVTDPQGGSAGEITYDIQAGQKLPAAELRIPSPQLWYPNGYGEQPLYKVEIKLSDSARQFDSWTQYTGLRKLEYVSNEDSPSEALPYTFVVNGKKIYIKGVNMTPLDHLYGNVSESRYDWIVHLAKSAHMNMIRIWGGGIIEKPYLYELCDRYGIMIWQEFIQSSSGVDNIPSKRPEFLELLKISAVEALRNRRNHVCLTVWSGGNELMSAPNTPSTYEDENLAILKALVAEYDPQRLFLPTSASGPVQYITPEKGVSHDVHGHWKFQNNPHHYELYGEADHLFHSEFGVDGVSAVKSIRKFLSPDHQHPVPMTDSFVWRHHGEWWDTYDRDMNMFGSIADLPQFVDCSQWIQAEGLRFILEANRRRQFHNSGSIVWQLNEPWPNVSCTNLVDYYKETKMAYYWVKKAFAPEHVSMDYRKLNYEAGENFAAPVFVHRNDKSAFTKVRALVLDSSGVELHVQHFEGESAGGRSTMLGELKFTVPQTENGLFFIRLYLETGTTGSVENIYVMSTVKEHVYAPALSMNGAALTVEAKNEWVQSAEIGPDGCEIMNKVFVVTNTGTEAALFVYPQEQTDRYWMTADRAYDCIFPGEKLEVTVTCMEKSGELFTKPEIRKKDECFINGNPVIEFLYFGCHKHVPQTDATEKAASVAVATA
ncbi:glycoside hydrolase family 2 protein [Paenibacillus hexagrammi]|uniref:beta-mannosidase n=1 Tax=Paenibacillus hexagrammi TaxID=2908839 RepID=A0ABY3SFU0_9BACL|nr:glycoside hydrolase family 2 TIM barrel-domain containing protein [Paenibacillus sp. YPD9-1]UJF31797.1 hypothetical protein L0M14_18735 [Paenibacillus sp. YPD9-1]